MLGLPPSGPEVSEIADGALAERLQSLLDNNDNANLQALYRSFNSRFDAGFSTYIFDATAEEFVSGMIVHYVHDLVKEELEEVSRGLGDVGLLQLRQQFPNEAKTFLHILKEPADGIQNY